MAKLLVAIPCYNCEKQLPRVLEELNLLSSRFEKDWFILIVDNRSTDNTLTVARKTLANSQFHSKVILLNNENYGLGGSQKVAFQFARAENIPYVCILHGDNQARSQEVESLWQTALADETAAAVLGSRFSRGSRRYGYSKLRTAGNKGLNILFTLICRKKTQDLGSGLNLFQVKDFPKADIEKFSDKFTFNMDLLLYIFTKNLRYIYIPIQWHETDQVSNARTFRVGWQTLITLYKWTTFKGKHLHASDKIYSSEVVS